MVFGLCCAYMRKTKRGIPPTDYEGRAAILLDNNGHRGFLSSNIPQCPESGALFADGVPCYPVGYEPIRQTDVMFKYMTEDEVRVHQIQKERNKLLARTSSEMINDHTAKVLLAKSSSAELMKRAQSPDE